MDAIKAGGFHGDNHRFELMMLGKNIYYRGSKVLGTGLSIRKRFPLDQIVLIEVDGGNNIRAGSDIYPDE